ncbi:MAG: hypothetical protein WC310_00590 [Patescibacteria group bacterium]|jgi:hypothetical protein
MLSNNLLLKKMSVFLAPLILIMVWEVWLLYSRAAVEIGILTCLIVFFSVWYLTNRFVAVSELQKSLHYKEFWRFLITPGVFILAVYFFIMILESGFWQQFMVFFANIIFLLILQNLFDRFYLPAGYPARSFESISGNVNIISLFLFLTVAYSFIAFLNFSVWLSATFFLFLAIMLIYQTMWISGITVKQSWLYLIVIGLLLLETFWSLVFLPNTYYVKALVISLVYYALINLARNQLIGLLNRKMVLRYLLISVIVLGLIWGTAQWL